MRTTTKAIAMAILGLLVVAASANAQVFRCEAGGRTVFSDRRCDADAVAVDPRPAAGDFDRAAAAARDAQTSRIRAGLEADEAERRAAREAAEASREAERGAQARRCSELRLRAQELASRAARIDDPKRARRERAKATQAADDLWWACRTLG
ncbi:MAG: DUF4124 domain-containing protein [Thauera phenolivorans]|uniref:DUF4124 domain-containing protein n=1 Tax=Thauera phenolivorans TaxID=1792543 RepID=A0A7X7LV84_9RHOO|nr:DUF4124 domain-containing protein [Thauera phenolivorans]NLF53705.1 DUF4124 domain-containing protein [Thauera phenolivorans]